MAHAVQPDSLAAHLARFLAQHLDLLGGDVGLVEHGRFFTWGISGGRPRAIRTLT